MSRFLLAKVPSSIPDPVNCCVASLYATWGQHDCAAFSNTSYIAVIMRQVYMRAGASLIVLLSNRSCIAVIMRVQHTWCSCGSCSLLLIVLIVSCPCRRIIRLTLGCKQSHNKHQWLRINTRLEESVDVGLPDFLKFTISFVRSGVLAFLT